MDSKKESLAKLALDYHSKGRPGKIEVNATKPCITVDDLSLAYTPGVAEPCKEIAKDQDKAFQYTAKGNLVAVISNGTAVLGLGNIGPLAGKPVMEGKGVLFKRFADIDVFDIEIDQTSVEGMVNVIKALEPTFGGINLEDIKAPECFEVEQQLIEKMDIPVFHDDQHGTAIIASAGFLNAVEIQQKKMETIKVVFNGAGAAAIACAKLFFELGVKKENLIMCDSKGVIFKNRKERMNKYKEEFAISTEARTLSDAMKGADAFIGCSVAGAVTKEMVASMGKKPIIFAMANPTPEIFPNEVAEVRSDAIMATGRSDFPNQVNNVLGFPFIFRGALDVHAKKINLEMKLAAVHALAKLAKKEVPDEVRMAYGNENFSFGPTYIIPKPFDQRVLTTVAPAVAKAAIDSGVARTPIEDLKIYARELSERLGVSATFMKSIRDNLSTKVANFGKKVRIVFAAGSNSRVLNAINSIIDENLIEPILIGNKDRIHKKLEVLNLGHLQDLQVIDPENHDLFKKFVDEFFKNRQRKGISKSYARELMAQSNYFGSMMVNEGLADALISGPTQTFPECFIPAMNVIGTKDHTKSTGIFILVFKQRVIFLADCTAQIDPSSEDLAEIAKSTASLYQKLMKRDPRVAFLSFSNFGSSSHPKSIKIQKAVQITKQLCPNMIVDGEIQADVAVNKHLLKNLFDFSSLDDSADILIFPDLNSANISYKLISQFSEVQPIGPILAPMNQAVNIVQRTSNVNEIINMSYVTALLSFQ
jgi:malate dehydrogenase (oxaloacetate-decarboxylating)(NADP+)